MNRLRRDPIKLIPESFGCERATRKGARDGRRESFSKGGREEGERLRVRRRGIRARTRGGGQVVCYFAQENKGFRKIFLDLDGLDILMYRNSRSAQIQHREKIAEKEEDESETSKGTSSPPSLDPFLSFSAVSWLAQLRQKTTDLLISSHSDRITISLNKNTQTAAE